MGFSKGNNFGGRKKGSKNKANTTLKKTFEKLLNDNLEGLQADLDALKPLDRLKVMIDLSTFITPRLKAVDMEVSSDGEKIDMPMINFIKTNKESNRI